MMNWTSLSQQRGAPWQHTLDILPQMQIKRPYKYAKFPHKSILVLKKESIVRFKLATNILLSFSNMACSFITFARAISNGLSIKRVANKQE